MTCRSGFVECLYRIGAIVESVADADGDRIKGARIGPAQRVGRKHSTQFTLVTTGVVGFITGNPEEIPLGTVASSVKLQYEFVVRLNLGIDNQAVGRIDGIPEESDIEIVEFILVVLTRKRDDEVTRTLAVVVIAKLRCIGTRVASVAVAIVAILAGITLTPPSYCIAKVKSRFELELIEILTQGIIRNELSILEYLPLDRDFVIILKTQCIKAT